MARAGKGVAGVLVGVLGARRMPDRVVVEIKMAPLVGLERILLDIVGRPEVVEWGRGLGVETIVWVDRDCGVGLRTDAIGLTPKMVAEDPRPITLVVPDGSWRQAAKSAQREPVLNNLPRIILPDMGPTQYQLRHEPKAGGLGTFEAMARALRVIEGEETYQKLNTLFMVMVERTLATRG